MGPGHLKPDTEWNNNTLAAACEKHHSIIDLFLADTRLIHL